MGSLFLLPRKVVAGIAGSECDSGFGAGGGELGMLGSMGMGDG